MKKIISLFIALTLLVSMFTVVAVASAMEGNVTRTVTVVDGKFTEIVGDDLFITDKEDFAGWLTTSAQVAEVFSGINYLVKDVDEAYDSEVTYDVVKLQICTDNPRYDDHWTSYTLKKATDASLTAAVDVDKVGYVNFRYVAEYKANETDIEVTKVYTEIVTLWVVDQTAPVVELTTTLNNKIKDGLTAGTAYTISTSLTITDSSSTTVTYVVEKLIEGNWTKVYDSADGIVEDYEGEDISSGKITPTDDDVSATAIYKIIYTVTDAYGYVGNTVEMPLFVNAKKVTETEDNDVDVWKIVLYCIAGLSACGIVALLLIKPKKVDERVLSAGKNVQADEDKAE